MDAYIAFLVNTVRFFSQSNFRPVNTRTTTVNNVDLGELLPFVVGGLIFLVVAITLGYVGFKAFTDGVKRASKEKKSLKSTLFEVRLPKSNESEIQTMDQMLTGFLSISKDLEGWEKYFGSKFYVSFELVAFPDSIRFYVNVPTKLASFVEKQINGAYPDAEIIFADEYNLFAPGQSVEFCALKLAEDDYKPIKIYEEQSKDALSSITSAMSKLSLGEGMALQMVLVPAGDEWRKDGKKYVKKVRENNSDPEKKKMDVDEDTLTAIEKMAEKPGFKTDLRLVSVSPDSHSAKANLDNLVYAFDQFTLPQGNKFKKDSPKRKSKKKKLLEAFIYRFPDEQMVLNSSEIATIYHFPNNQVLTPNIHWLTSKRAPAAADIPSEYTDGGVYIGVNKYRGIEKRIFLNQKDRRRHMYFVGKTGAGKSVFLQHLAYQDILNGNGLAFLDPHGDAVEWLLERIPPERAEDVIYFNPADTDRPIGMNIMEWYTEQDKHIVVNGFLGLLNKLFDPHNQGITGPRFEQAVRNAMLTVMSKKGTSLAEVMVLLQNDKNAQQYFPYLDDETVKKYWTEQIANTNEFHKSEVLGYIVSKFDRFITNKLMRNIISQSKSGFDFRDVMDKGKIMLVNLSKGKLGEENAQFLGLLLVPKLLQAAMSRADMDEKLRKDFYLYVDEFQNFATPDFAQILSEARKYRLSLVVANQYIAQMTDEIRDAIFGNTGTIASFKIGVNDAQHMASEFDPVFDQTDLINLENLNLYIKLLNNGEYPAPFSVALDTDLVFKTPPNHEVKDLVYELSRLRYGRDRKLVEAEIKAREEAGLADKGVAPQPTSIKPPAK